MSANNAVISLARAGHKHSLAGPFLGPKFDWVQNFRPNVIGPLKTVTGHKHISLGPVITNTWTPLWTQIRDISLLVTNSLMGTHEIMTTATTAMSPRKPMLKYHIDRLVLANWNRINKTEDEEYHKTLFRTCRQACIFRGPLLMLVAFGDGPFMNALGPSI